MRSAFDFAPFRRSTVGFDRLFDMLENGNAGNGGENYPPFDLIRTGENDYRIELAVAGFKAEEIDITAQQNVLLVSGKKSEESENRGQDYVYRGIATRSSNSPISAWRALPVRNRRSFLRAIAGPPIIGPD